MKQEANDKGNGVAVSGSSSEENNEGNDISKEEEDEGFDGGSVGHMESDIDDMVLAGCGVGPLLEQLTSDEEGNNYHSEDFNTTLSFEVDEAIISRTVYPPFKEGAELGHVNLELGMEFATMDIFKKAMKDYTIHLGREIKWVKNDKVRVKAKCKVDECPWKIFCFFSNVTKNFQVKTFNQEHTCARGFKNKDANTKWVMKKLAKKLRTQPMQISFLD